MQSLSLHSIEAEYPDVLTDILNHMTQKNCSRCGGMMVQDTCMDLFSDYGEFKFQVLHCIQCGELIDPFILLNRLKKNPSSRFSNGTS
ncbi:MAG: hypothetical protein WD425_07465 [Nitrospirales bacterium]